jgi:hypothetical protein
MRLMYDSTTASAIPANAEIVAGYVDGRYAWSQADWNRFPNAQKVRIAVFPWTNDGEVLDCEPGDATPAECAAWIKMRQASGVQVPTIYCSASDLPAVRAACEGLTYDVWLADPTGVPHNSHAATQYAWTNTGGHYDLSLCADYWPRTGEDMAELIPQDYKDKFGQDVTWQGVADNLEGIIHSLQAKIEQVKAVVDD